ncbi:helix-turn-helix domain-containing protein [Butyrivibrio sp. AE3006]|uniref:helix-turn-helix domain-containing protein n=1 Tax=Butyrivibrio sp. AE3006 TaxID=1280673 RepID=UPI00042A29A2|nr:helix-turn-helix domain-containing protein [Butyrivibrio sp. AE3006]
MQDKVVKQMEVALSDYLFKQREEEFVHATLSQEMSGFDFVKNGDISGLKRFLVKHRKAKFPKLSQSPVLQERYLFVSVITTCCRVCIESGMPSDESYGLSDLYILKMDKLNSADEIKALYEEMMLDYAVRMKAYHEKSTDYSPRILLCMEYIENHMHDRITVQTLADELEMNASWLSTVFAKEVGVSVSDFIRQKKISAAKFLLSYNEYTCTDIAEYLGFAGESHFSTLFKKYEGVTPKEYRKKTYNKTFTNLA